MRSRFLTLIVFLLYAVFTFSQKNETGDLLLKANEVLYDDPAQAIKIGNHLLHNPVGGNEKAQTALLLAKGNLVIGNYSQSIANVHLALAAARQSGNKSTLFEILLLAAEIYSYSDLTAISNQFLSEAEKIAKDNPVFKKQAEAYRLFVAAEIQDAARSIKFLQKRKSSSNPSVAFFITKGTQLQLTADAFQKSSPDSALVYYEKNLGYIDKQNSGNYWSMLALLDYGSYLFEKKAYNHAIVLLELALEKGQQIRNPFYVMLINDKLSECSFALGNTKLFGEYRQKSSVAGNEYETQATLATNFAFEMLQREKEQKLLLSKASRRHSYLFLGISAVIILLLWVFVKWQYATKISHTADIVNYLKLIRETAEKQEVIKPGAKPLAIPKETEAAILAKLEKFESGKKYLSKEMSLAQMAALFDINTKYLSEVVNKYKGRNINLYINELRIRYIVEKLKNDPKYLNYKVSYLAEECGFSSHSSFSAVFRSITGITPNVFIQFLSQDLHTQKPQNGLS